MFFYRLLATLSRPLARVLFRPRVQGLEHVPAEGGFLLCANHLSGFDAFALGYALYPCVLRNMGKPQLFERPLLGPLVTSLGAFPARRGTGEDGAVAAAARLAQAGEAVVVFPEGARRRKDRVHKPRSGAARAALAAGMPVVPAAIRGTDRWRRLGRWEITVGPPVSLDDLRALEPSRAAREGTRRTWDAIVALEGFPR